MPQDSDDPGPEPDPRRRALGEAIKRARMARNRSQRHLADAARISVRSLAYAEAGQYVGLKMLLAIEATLGWPEGKVLAYLEGDDEALSALTARAPGISDATLKQLAELGLTIDIVGVLEAMERLRDLRAKMFNDELFVDTVLRMTHPHPRKGPKKTG